MNAKGTKLASNPKFLPANYKAWARRPYWKIHEVARLVIGHDPVQPHPRKVMLDDGTDSPEQSVALRAVEDILNRCIKTEKISEPLNPYECVTLLQRQGVNIPDELVSEVDAAVQEDPSLFAPRDSEQVTALKDEVARLKNLLDERSTGTLLKLLLAVAIRKYKLREKSTNAVASAIEADTIDCGFNVSERSIRDWLNKAERHCAK